MVKPAGSHLGYDFQHLSLAQQSLAGQGQPIEKARKALRNLSADELRTFANTLTISSSPLKKMASMEIGSQMDPTRIVTIILMCHSPEHVLEKLNEIITGTSSVAPPLPRSPVPPPATSYAGGFFKPTEAPTAAPKPSPFKPTPAQNQILQGMLAIFSVTLGVTPEKIQKGLEKKGVLLTGSVSRWTTFFRGLESANGTFNQLLEVLSESGVPNSLVQKTRTLFEEAVTFQNSNESPYAYFYTENESLDDLQERECLRLLDLLFRSDQATPVINGIEEIIRMKSVEQTPPINNAKDVIKLAREGKISYAKIALILEVFGVNPEIVRGLGTIRQFRISPSQSKVNLTTEQREALEGQFHLLTVVKRFKLSALLELVERRSGTSSGKKHWEANLRDIVSFVTSSQIVFNHFLEVLKENGIPNYFIEEVRAVPLMHPEKTVRYRLHAQNLQEPLSLNPRQETELRKLINFKEGNFKATLSQIYTLLNIKSSSEGSPTEPIVHLLQSGTISLDQLCLIMELNEVNLDFVRRVQSVPKQEFPPPLLNPAQKEGLKTRLTFIQAIFGSNALLFALGTLEEKNKINSLNPNLSFQEQIIEFIQDGHATLSDLASALKESLGYILAGKESKSKNLPIFLIEEIINLRSLTDHELKKYHSKNGSIDLNNAQEKRLLNILAPLFTDPESVRQLLKTLYEMNGLPENVPYVLNGLSKVLELLKSGTVSLEQLELVLKIRGVEAVVIEQVTQITQFVFKPVLTHQQEEVLRFQLHILSSTFPGFEFVKIIEPLEQITGISFGGGAENLVEEVVDYIQSGKATLMQLADLLKRKGIPASFTNSLRDIPPNGDPNFEQYRKVSPLPLTADQERTLKTFLISVESGDRELSIHKLVSRLLKFNQLPSDTKPQYSFEDLSALIRKGKASLEQLTLILELKQVPSHLVQGIKAVTHSVVSDLRSKLSRLSQEHRNKLLHTTFSDAVQMELIHESDSEDKLNDLADTGFSNLESILKALEDLPKEVSKMLEAKIDFINKLTHQSRETVIALWEKTVKNYASHHSKFYDKMAVTELIARLRNPYIIDPSLEIVELLSKIRMEISPNIAKNIENAIREAVGSPPLEPPLPQTGLGKKLADILSHERVEILHSAFNDAIYQNLMDEYESKELLRKIGDEGGNTKFILSLLERFPDIKKIIEVKIDLHNRLESLSKQELVELWDKTVKSVTNGRTEESIRKLLNIPPFKYSLTPALDIVKAIETIRRSDPSTAKKIEDAFHGKPTSQPESAPRIPPPPPKKTTPPSLAERIKALPKERIEQLFWNLLWVHCSKIYGEEVQNERGDVYKWMVSEFNLLEKAEDTGAFVIEFIERTRSITHDDYSLGGEIEKSLEKEVPVLPESPVRRSIPAPPPLKQPSTGTPVLGGREGLHSDKKPSNDQDRSYTPSSKSGNLGEITGATEIGAAHDTSRGASETHRTEQERKRLLEEENRKGGLERRRGH